MGIKPGKTEVRKLAAVMEQPYDTVEEAAEAALAEAWRLLEERGCWTVVGQLRYSPEGGWVDHDEAQAAKIALGWYATENMAAKAAQSLYQSGTTGEEFRTWVLPVFQGSPHEYFTVRKKEKARLDGKDDESVVGKRESALQRRIDFYARNGHANFPIDIDDDSDKCGRCGQEVPPDMQDQIQLP